MQDDHIVHSILSSGSPTPPYYLLLLVHVSICIYVYSLGWEGGGFGGIIS